MSFEFEENNNEFQRDFSSRGASGGIVVWLVKNKYLPSENAANIFLIILSILVIVFSVWLFNSSGNNTPTREPLTELEKIEIRNQPGFNELPEPLQKSLLGEDI